MSVKKEKTVKFKVTQKDYEALKHLSETRGYPMSQLIRVSIWNSQFKDDSKNNNWGLY